MREKGLVEELDAVAIRYSGKMDIAVLQIVNTHSSFQPLPIATSSCIGEGGSNMECALVAFDLASDGDDLRGTGTQADLEVDISGLSRLSHIPQWFSNRVCSVRETKLGARRFLKARSEYTNEKGLSGGAVVGMENGRVVLFGVHTNNERLAFNEQYSYIAGKLTVGENNGEGEEKATEEDSMTDIADAVAASSSSSVSASSSSRSDDSGAVTNSRDSHSGSIDDPAMKTVKQVADNLSHNVGATGRSVFIVAHSLLTQHRKWKLEVMQHHQVSSILIPQPPALPPSQSTSSVTSSSSSIWSSRLRVRAPKLRGSPQTSSRYGQAQLHEMKLYDISETE